MGEGILSERCRVFDSLFHSYEGPGFSIRLWDGWQWSLSGESHPKCTIIFKSKGALKSLVANPTEAKLGECFISTDIDVEGDLYSAFAVAEHAFHRPKAQYQQVAEVIGEIFCSLEQRWHRGGVHSEQRDKAAISYHYDQPVEFFQPWLGKSLAYSCAYFSSGTESLDVAQENKLELICRKLRLKPLERFLDIGCGWGSLPLHAASQHNVFAQGITLSHQQSEVANDRIVKGRLTQSCKVDLLDYRDSPKYFSSFDKMASVGMFEHVGLKNLPQYFRTAYDLLKPGGVFLNHGIAKARSLDEEDEFPVSSLASLLPDALRLKHHGNASFIDKYVFPDGELVTLAEAVQAAESVGFEVRDVENLREHYELTLRCWTEALQSNAEELLRHVSEKTYRIWMLYMAGCAAAFERGDIALYQMLLSRPDHGKSRVPLTRADWYRTSP